MKKEKTFSKILSQFGALFHSPNLVNIPGERKINLNRLVGMNTHMAKGELHSVSILLSHSTRTFTKPQINPLGQAKLYQDILVLVTFNFFSSVVPEYLGKMIGCVLNHSEGISSVKQSFKKKSMLLFIFKLNTDLTNHINLLKTFCRKIKQILLEVLCKTGKAKFHS